MGGFLTSLLYKTNDSYCYFLSRQGRKKGAGGEAPGKFSKLHLFYQRETPFLIKRGYYINDTFVNLLKSAGVYTPRTS